MQSPEMHFWHMTSYLTSLRPPLSIGGDHITIATLGEAMVVLRSLGLLGGAEREMHFR